MDNVELVPLELINSNHCKVSVNFLNLFIHIYSLLSFSVAPEEG